MGSGLGGSAERKGGEIVELCEPDKCLTVSACKQLWNWVGEQRDTAEEVAGSTKYVQFIWAAQGKQSAYSNVRLYMRKFFAGLIDFDNEGESQDERLSEDV